MNMWGVLLKCWYYEKDYIFSIMSIYECVCLYKSTYYSHRWVYWTCQSCIFFYIYLKYIYLKDRVGETERDTCLSFGLFPKCPQQPGRDRSAGASNCCPTPPPAGWQSPKWLAQDPLQEARSESWVPSTEPGTLIETAARLTLAGPIVLPCPHLSLFSCSQLWP